MTFEKLAALIRARSNGTLAEAQDPVILIMTFAIALVVIVSLFALMAAIWLSISYAKYHHQQNTAGKTGRELARQVLDDHGLGKIKVASSGSILLGNSYSHLFKKVRLHRRIAGQASVAALATAVQKPCLAILDARDDADMKSRRRATPLICLGPWALIPLMLVGWALDLIVSAKGWCTVAFTLLAVVLYGVALVSAFRGLKTENAAQVMALDLMTSAGLATADETAQCKKLYRLHRVEYVNNMFLAPLELLYRLVQLFTGPRDNTQADAPTDP